MTQRFQLNHLAYFLPDFCTACFSVVYNEFTYTEKIVRN